MAFGKQPTRDQLIPHQIYLLCLQRVSTRSELRKTENSIWVNTGRCPAGMHFCDSVGKNSQLPNVVQSQRSKMVNIKIIAKLYQGIRS